MSTGKVSMKPDEGADDRGGGLIDFNEIVDPDISYYEQHSSQLFMGALIESLPFRIGILMTILTNSIVVGLQTNKYLEARYGAVFLGLDKFFQTIFATEILMKWYHDFLGFWRVGWNIFDFIILAATFIVPGIGVRFLSGSRILHILRVLNATRSLRNISTLRGLQIVMQTVLYSIPDVAYVMTLLVICIYIFAILGNSIFGDDCPQNFGTVERTMFSLFVCITQDGWLRIVMELTECGHQIVGPIYLVVFITMGAFVFANLVVAVVVTNLELVIAEKNEIERRLLIIKKGAGKEEQTPVLKIYAELFEKAYSQKPLILNPQPLDEYFKELAAMEVNLMEFKKFKEELLKIQEELLQLMEELEEGRANEELVELGSIRAPKSHTQRRQSRTNLVQPSGDVMSDLLQSIGTGQARSIHHMMNQIAQHPSEHASTRKLSLMQLESGRRLSHLVDPAFLPQSSPQGRVSQFVISQGGSSRRSSQHMPYHPRRFSSGQRLSSAGQHFPTIGHRHSSAGHTHRHSSAGHTHPSLSHSSSHRYSSAGHTERSSSIGQHLTLTDRRTSSADEQYRSRRHTLSSVPEIVTTAKDTK